MKKALIFLFTVFAAISCTGRKDGDFTLEILTTNDIHGTWFDSTYVGGGVRNSIYAVKNVVDSVRLAAGKENVLLLDAGDCLQGDNAAYYFNYVDTVDEHLYVRLAHYMEYDGITVGNHDIEAGHKVYDRVTEELASYDIPFFGANAIRNDNGKPYFPAYKIFERGGLRVAVLGFTNPNMAAWLSESLWCGMTFKSLLPFVQETVDKVVRKEKPDAVVVLVHSGVGSGNGSILESQGLDLYKSLKNVDVLVCSHDHRPIVYNNDGEGFSLINSGSHCRNVGHGTINVSIKNGKVVKKTVSASLIPVDAERVDTTMRRIFHPDFEKVRAFTLQYVGENKVPLCSKACYAGQADYMNLIHTIQLAASTADISFAAPLKHNGYVPVGKIIYNDLFTIYPFENQLYVMTMTGQEILNCMEYSYDHWIQTASSPKDHVLRIVCKGDSRNGDEGWSFVNASFNFDSFGGLCYEVDVTRKAGERIQNLKMADGSAFDLNRKYKVALTSYRANGGGDILPVGGGIQDLNDRIVARYPEIRDLLYDFILKHGSIDETSIRNYSKIGQWKFVPESVAEPAIKKDLSLVFGK
ncbi:MAG: bifunctional metallophosphatase/5'-nucleotidase [Bacteroidales bacterium]|nr:bifunctional metallophosphatase/5'-nucleotidase [Bacteroidales bacterium]